MAAATDNGVKEILEKYEDKLAERRGEKSVSRKVGGLFSREYDIFRKEALLVTTSIYEKACQWAENIIKAKVKPEEEKRLKEAIETIHLKITPGSAVSLANVVLIGFIAVGILIGLLTFLLFDEPSIPTSILFILMGVLVVKPLSKYPIHLETKWRLEASNQMVPCILYIVMFMRHTSNLEHAVRFAGQHIGPPLSLDLRKIFWDVETRRFSTMKEALDNYLKGWKDWNLEFVEAFHLIESSLYESKEEKRISLLEKSLKVMLEGTYDRMLHYAHDVKSPITMLHMMGVILPILGLIILPLLGSFMGAKWYHIGLLYNIILPIVVYYIGYKILIKRPMGYAQTNIAEETEEYQKARMLSTYVGGEEVLIKPRTITTFIIIASLLIGCFPLIFHQINVLTGNPLQDIPLGDYGNMLDYRETDKGKIIGPLGMGATMFSLLIPLGLALGIGAAYKIKSRKLIKMRNETKKLEKEFVSALFQLGNRVEHGIPAEMAFGKISQDLGGTPSGKFFSLVNTNIRKLGMTVENAIFNEKVGAILEFPSSVIESSMKILIESAKKGPKAVAKSLLSISEYMDKIDKVNERLKDLLADIVSSMKAQISFLTPFIAGIVVGVGGMMTAIISSLSKQMAEMGGGGSFGGMDAGTIMNMFPLEKMIPPFYFQLVVGIYAVQIIIVLTILANGIENGIDKLNEEHSLGKNLFTSLVLYTVVAAVTTIIFNMLAMKLGGVG